MAFWSGDSARYWQVYQALENEPAVKLAFDMLTLCEIDEWRSEDAKRNANRRKEKLAQRAKNIAILQPLISDLREGRQAGHLAWGATHFFSERERKNTRITGIELLTTYVNDDISSAMASGWNALVDGDLCGVSIEMLGTVAAKGTRYVVEDAAMAGLVLRIRKGASFKAPLEMGLIALRNGFRLRDKNTFAKSPIAKARQSLECARDGGCLKKSI
jgi:hypothetical protein